MTPAPTPSPRLDFPLVAGGPLEGLWRRLRISGYEAAAVRRRVAVLVSLSWLPLLTLSIVDGAAWRGSVALPFLFDFEVHIRFLLAVPMLVIAEGIVQQRLRSIAMQFVERGLVPDQAMPSFAAALAAVTRLRESKAAEVLMIALVYGVGLMLLWRTQIALDVSTWYGARETGVLQPSRAGWWFGFVSLPVFQFLLLRWLYRQAIWAVFLWKVSRLDLKYVPKHPDGAGGVGFLANASYAFAPLLLAESMMLAGTVANRIFYAGAALPDFKLELAGILVLMLAIVFAPLLFFSRRLEAAKRAGFREYGRLVERCQREFDDKWLRGRDGPGETLVGSPDLESMAALCEVYAVVRSMRWFPFTLQHVMFLGATALVPLLPLSLTMFPMEELLDRLMKYLF